MPPAINMGTVNWNSSSYTARALSTISPGPRFLSVHFSPARLLPCTSREGTGLDLASTTLTAITGVCPVDLQPWDICNRTEKKKKRLEWNSQVHVLTHSGREGIDTF